MALTYEQKVIKRASIKSNNRLNISSPHLKHTFQHLMNQRSATSDSFEKKSILPEGDVGTISGNDLLTINGNNLIRI